MEKPSSPLVAPIRPLTPDDLSNIHQILLERASAFGYLTDARGMCSGFTARWLEAFLNDSTRSFLDRIQIILTDDTIIEKLKSIKEKIKQGYDPTDEEKYLFEIPAFFERILLYQAPRDYSDVFNQSLTQLDLPKISEIAASEETLSHGGLRSDYFEVGVYTEYEIELYLDDLADAIDKTDCESDTKISFWLANASHAVGLTYMPQVGLWSLMNINTFPPSREDEGDACHISRIIAKTFGSENNLYTAFNTSLVILNDNIYGDDLTKNLNETKKSHIVSSEVTTRQDKVENTLLHYAATHNEVSIIQQLAQYGIDPVNADGDTPLILSAMWSHLESLTLLVECGANVHLANKKGATALHYAAKRNGLEAIDLLYESSANIGARTTDGTTPIHAAALGGHVNAIEKLNSFGADINAQKTNGVMPIHDAALGGHVDAIVKLQQLGADINAQRFEGSMPIHAAAFNGHIAAIRKLNELGVNVNAQNTNGVTPIHIAASKGHVDAIIELQQLGADVNVVNKGGETPLFTAVRNKQLNAIAKLIELGANPDIPNSDGATPLFYASQEGLTDTVQLLLESSHAQTVAFVSNVRSLRDFASEYNPKVKRRMIDFIFRPKDKEKIPLLPIDIAYIMGHKEITLLLQNSVRDTPPDVISQDVSGLSSFSTSTNLPEAREMMCRYKEGIQHGVNQDQANPKISEFDNTKDTPFSTSI